MEHSQTEMLLVLQTAVLKLDPNAKGIIKQAKFLKQFRRVKEDTKADKIHQDLVNDLHHVQRINKKFKDIILTDFSEQDKTFEKIILSLLRQVNTLTESSLQILDRTVPLEISEHIAKKNLYINRERNYL
ncbi:unnamed protein product [Aphanomyces euteiches]